MANGAHCPLPVVDSASSLARLETTMIADVEAYQSRATTMATAASLSFRDFLNGNEAVSVPQRVAELRAKRTALASNMLSSDTEFRQ